MVSRGYTRRDGVVPGPGINCVVARTGVDRVISHTRGDIVLAISCGYGIVVTAGCNSVVTGTGNKRVITQIVGN